VATEAPPRKSLLKSRAVQLTLGLMVSAVCIWWAAKELIDDPAARQQFLNAFRTADYRFLPLLLGMLAVFYLLKAYRWKLLLSPLGDFRTVGDCFGPMISGFAVNNVLPARAGELLRTVVFAKQTGRPFTSVLTTVALERIFDMLAILVCLAVGLLSVPGMPAWMTKSAMGLGAVVMVAVLGAVVFMIWTQAFVRFASATLRVFRVPETLRNKIQELMEVAATGLDSLKSPRTLALIVLVSLMKWFINGSMMYLSLLSFGVQVPFAAALVLLGVVAILVAAPTAPGFFGVIQLCFTETLQFFPVPQQAVLAASIYYHMIQYIPVTLGGLYWLNRSGIRLGEVEQVRSREGEAPAEPHARA
jgi:uncharacterized protein (TIRG00374 family)